MKIWNKSICLNSRKTLLLIVVVLLSTLVLAGVWPTKDEEIKTITQSLDREEMWVPTEEDIAYQDSMYQIIRSTQNDINDIKKDIVHILERLDYEDGTWDSIRYVKGGVIDKRRNK
jgi:hypothetical protein|tara:strand:- start:343 stop:690 length:348 start_codon:yes stop_codon:yes gene_type:complete